MILVGSLQNQPTTREILHLRLPCMLQEHASAAPDSWPQWSALCRAETYYCNTIAPSVIAVGLGEQARVGPDQRAPPPRLSPFEYRYLTEFQSHEPEFDYLKSLEIEEKINQVIHLKLM